MEMFIGNASSGVFSYLWGPQGHNRQKSCYVFVEEYTTRDHNVKALLHWNDISCVRWEVTRSRDQTFFMPIRYYLPYGIYHCQNGNEVLFNRDYEPIWARDKTTQKVEKIDNIFIYHADEDGHLIKNTMIYDDFNPNKNKISYEKCLSVLDDWGVKNEMPIIAEKKLELVKNGILPERYGDDNPFVKYRNGESVEIYGKNGK